MTLDAPSGIPRSNLSNSDVAHGNGVKLLKKLHEILFSAEVRQWAGKWTLSSLGRVPSESLAIKRVQGYNG